MEIEVGSGGMGGSSIMSVERLDAKFCTRPVCRLEEGHICDEFIS